MKLGTLAAILLAALIGMLLAAAGGYHKGKADAELVAKNAMDRHVLQDTQAELVAKEAANNYKDALAESQNAVSAAYEKGKSDAQATAQRTVADLRAGNLVLRERWSACEAAANVPRPASDPGQPDAGADDRAASAGRIVQAAAQCDAQVRGLQRLLILERQQDVQQSQPEVGAHVGPLPD